MTNQTEWTAKLADGTSTHAFTKSDATEQEAREMQTWALDHMGALTANLSRPNAMRMAADRSRRAFDRDGPDNATAYAIKFCSDGKSVGHIAYFAGSIDHRDGDTA